MNKVLPILLALAVVALGSVFYYATREKPETQAYLAPAAGEGPRVGDLRGRTTGRPGDRDGAHETIRTLTQLQERLSRDLEAERGKNKVLGEKLDQTRLDVTQSLSEQQQQVEQKLKQALDAMKESFKTQTKKGQQYIEQKISDLPKPKPGAMPSGLGFDNLNLPIGGAKGRGGDHGLDLKPPPRYISVRPMGVSLESGTGSNEGGLLSGLPGLGIFGANRKASGGKGQAKALEAVRKEAAEKDVQKRYTINDVATLYQNTTMTALLGRVPVNNRVADPYRFKVITGGDNLAASGLKLPPNIKHIVWTGYTIGNRELSCADGYLDTVTLVFQDGTISTTTVKTAASKKSPTRKYLGYITDPWGKPCISGQLFSNASDYLRDRILVGALGAAAEGASAAETSTITNADGYFQTIVSGDTTDFILGQAAAGGLEETKEFVRERMRNAYDVVYVGTGRKVTIHVESEIHFDYDPKGRKLDHGVSDKQAFAAFD